MEKIGHRGAKAYVEENTIASIQKAIELGVDAIEIDVHVCKTGELIVIHDMTLNRTTNGKGKVRKLSYNEISKYTCNGEKVPTLKEVLEFCIQKCNIHIELKGKGTAIKTAELIKRFVDEKAYSYEQLLVSSFVKTRLKKIKKYNPKVKLGIITAKKPEKALRFASKNKLEAVYIVHLKLKSHLVRLAKLKGVRVYAWTVNETKDIQRMKKRKVYGIISDYPDRL